VSGACAKVMAKMANKILSILRSMGFLLKSKLALFNWNYNVGMMCLNYALIKKAMTSVETRDTKHRSAC